MTGGRERTSPDLNWYSGLIAEFDACRMGADSVVLGDEVEADNGFSAAAVDACRLCC